MWPRPLAVVLLALALAEGCARASPPAAVGARPADAVEPKVEPARATVVVETPSGPLPFRVELAQTDAERQRGLMFREKLAEDEGMLFLFEDMRIQSFWMKNTLLPLDMIFIDEQGVIVGIVENAEPMTLTSRKVDKPSRYVLEVLAGTSRKLGIAPGQVVRFEGVQGHPAGLAR